MRKGAYRSKLSGTMFKLRGDLVGDLLSVGGDDSKFAGSLGAADDVVADKTGDKAIENAKADRLIIVDESMGAVRLGIDKEGDDGDDGIENEGDPEEVQFLLFDADVFGDDVRAAGRGIVSKADAVHKAADGAAQKNGENGVVTLCVILELGET